MPHMTDTMRVEMSLPVHIMLAVLLSGANCAEPNPGTKSWDFWKNKVDTDPEFARSVKTFKETRALLTAACDEALEGVYPDKKLASLIRRIQRVHHEAVAPYLKDRSADPRKIGIMAYYLLQHLVDTGLLIVPEDSSFGKALAHLLPALSPTDDSTELEIGNYESLNKSARKQVRKILINLQNDGYYRGIPLPDYEIMELDNAA